MKLEDQVSSLEISKRLKELGVKQESLFYWSDLHYPANHKPKVVHESDCRHKRDRDLYSAFTVAELGELLPEFFRSERYYNAKEVKWNCYSDDSDDDGKCGYEERVIAENEADARGKMLIYLIENKLMELK